MNVTPRVAAALIFGALAACTAPGEAQRPPVVAAVAKVVDGLAAELQQRLATEAFRGLSIVVRNGAGEGTETVLAEILRTRLTERGATVEVACPAKCLEITLVEFVSEAAGALAPGQLLSLAQAQAALPGLPRPGGSAPLTAGQAGAVLATFAVRDGNRYSLRQQVVAVLALAKNPDAAP
jgi:hypothetical protein